ncbi:septum formation family protein [Mycobacterium paragordonae]|uniref:septum formation family protein n=1 Tax=Mycobacterium paragordonae TaxID=1389713 RepID=UPI003B8A8781
MLDAPEKEPLPDDAPGEAAELSAAEEPQAPDAAEPPEPSEPSEGFRWPRSLQASATRRGLLLTALGALLIAGLVTALPAVGTGPGRLAGFIDSNPIPSTGSKGNAAFARANSGDCLNWPDGTPESASIVNCADDHRFEVAESVDMRTFPGSEYGPSAAPPSPARIQQINAEQCDPAVRRYLGPKFDPNSKFTVSMLWSGDRAWKQNGERRMLCGLQLPGPNNEQVAFKGKIADIDQSKVWPAGTCLGIDPTTNQPVDVPVDCSAPHAMEVTGTVNLAEKYPNALPPEAEQDGFIKDACTKMTDAYLAPIKLRTTTLTLIYPTISLPSWSAGSREVACSIGATLGNGGWATLLNSAKGPLLINGQAPVPPPDIPQERLTLPQIPVQLPAQQPSAPQPQQQTPPTPQGDQHLPNQQPVVTPTRAPSSPASQAPSATQPTQAPPPGDAAAPPPAQAPEGAPVNEPPPG